MHAKTAKCISALHRQCAKMLQTTNNVRLIVMHGRDDSRLAEQKESHLALLGHVDVFMWVASLLQKNEKMWLYTLALYYALPSSRFFIG
jgi:precorrin-6B methylase 1